MTFRDDHDAALARADALEDEVERTKRERDALAAKLAGLEAEKAKKPPPPEPTSKSRSRSKRPASEEASSESTTRGEKRAVIGAVVATSGLIGFFAISGMRESRAYEEAHAAWQAKADARSAWEKRWRALSALEPCVHEIAWGSMSVRESTPDKVDPRVTSRYYAPGRATSRCYRTAAELLRDPKTTASVQTALGAWVDHQQAIELAATPADAYYTHQDWEEDNFAGAADLWKPVLATLERQTQLLEALRRDVLPPVRAEMQAMIEEHETSTGRDETYWRGALTVALYEITDRGFAAAGIYAGRPPDLAAAGKALQQPVTQFKELAKTAPIEVRRDLRRLDWILDPFSVGDWSRAETPLWHLQNGESDLLRGQQVPGLPPPAGKEPEQPSSD